MLHGTDVLTTAQMRAVESAAICSGKVSGLELMERAGAAVAGHIRLRWPKPGHATVLCGPGSNGGDGYVVARHLRRAGWRLRVLGMDGNPGPDAVEMRRQWAEIGPVLPLTADEFHRRDESSDVYVDAIFGAGLTRPPEGEIAEILSYLGGSGGDWVYFRERLVAVDCPSGMCMDSGAFPGRHREPGVFDLRVRMTVAFDSPKPGHLLERGPDCCGELIIADIGLGHWRKAILDGRAPPPPSLTALWPVLNIDDGRRFARDAKRRAAMLTKRAAPEGHKFSHGHALIIAGGPRHGGAARLAARAALRVGAGLVTICPPEAALGEHACPPDALMRRGVEDGQALAEILQDDRITAICIGPGCGVERARALLPVILGSGRRCVLDADALTVLAATSIEGLGPNCVLTPHAGEFARLFPGIAERLAAPKAPKAPHRAAGHANLTSQLEASLKSLADMRSPIYSKVDATRDAAEQSGAVILLKGPDTVIAEPPPLSGQPGPAAIHAAFDVPWLATAGSGDVLAGFITGLLARGLWPSDAAGTGAWLHAAAARRFGPGLIADDLPEQIPGIFRDLDG